MSIRLYMDVHISFNVTIGQCGNDLELMAKVYEPEDMVNQVEYLPLK